MAAASPPRSKFTKTSLTQVGTVKEAQEHCATTKPRGTVCMLVLLLTYFLTGSCADVGTGHGWPLQGQSVWPINGNDLIFDFFEEYSKPSN